MKAKIFSVVLGSILFFLLFLPRAALSQDLSPIVSTEWLAKNMNRPGLVILDVRKVEAFRDGHIPGAVNLFYRT